LATDGQKVEWKSSSRFLKEKKINGGVMIEAEDKLPLENGE